MYSKHKPNTGVRGEVWGLGCFGTITSANGAGKIPLVNDDI